MKILPVMKNLQLLHKLRSVLKLLARNFLIMFG